MKDICRDNLKHKGMKKELNLAAYESPKAKVVTVETEGAFCVSITGMSHEGYERGADLEF